MRKRGIDVSSWQGGIDWPLVKSSGIEFVMIRAGYGHFESQVDAQFKRNVDGCDKIGLPYGLYWYSYATTVAAARAEAETFLKTIKGVKPLYPVVLDIEDNVQAALDVSTLNSIIVEFGNIMEAAGYYFSVYSNLSWLTSKVGNIDRFDVWLGQWANEPTYKGQFGIWQYTDKGQVNGIRGNVDLDYSFRDYPEIIKNGGFNGWATPSKSYTICIGDFKDRAKADELAAFLNAQIVNKFKVIENPVD